MALTALQRQALERAHNLGGITWASVHSSTRSSLLKRGLLRSDALDMILYITEAGKAAIGVQDPAPSLPIEYGFPGVYDGFNALADNLGHETVGRPLHHARYAGSDFAYQVTSNGKMEAIKEGGAWVSAFYAAYVGKGWPIENNRQAWPVYRGSDAHIVDGQQSAVDAGNREGLAWTAYHDGTITSVVFGDPEAGNFCDLSWNDGAAFTLRYCHGKDVTVVVGQQVRQGDVLGHVGWSGMVFPPGPAGAHWHGALWRDGGRVRPEDWL